MKFSCEELIRTIQKEKYSTLKFGGIPSVGINIPGRLNVKGAEKLYKNYHVSDGEQVVAHLIKNSPLGADGVLITNDAIYLNPAGCSGKSTNRVLWSELHEFFVVHICDCAKVTLAKPTEKIEYQLLKQTLLDAKPGNELADFFLEMQRAILEKYPEFQNERTVQFKALKDQCEEMLNLGAISELNLSVLRNLLLEPAYAEQAAILMATDYARTHTKSQHSQWVESLPETLSADLRMRLNDLWAPTQQEFINALEDQSAQFDLRYLETVGKNLAQVDDLSPEEIYLIGLISVRLGKWGAVDLAISMLEKEDQQRYLNKLYFPRYFAANAQMQKILETIKRNKESLKKDVLSSFDSMGLTPYHYALIVEEPKVRADLLSGKKEWPEISQKQASAFGAIGIYDYLCLAIYKGLPYDDVKQVAIHTSEEASILQKRLSSQQNREAVEEIAQTFGALLMGAAESSGYCDTPEGKENYEQLGERLGDSADRAEDIKDTIQETVMELNECLDALFYNAEQKVSQWKESKDPVVRYLLHIYSDSEYLEKILSTSGEWSLYWLDNGYYYMAPIGEIETHKPPEDEATILVDTKLFGDSWFSPEAHINIEILKKEFRILAKEYHPDVSGDSQAEKIFQEISAEQESIEKSLEG